MAYVEQAEQTMFSAEKMEKAAKAIKRLQDAAERHEQTLPENLSPQEMNDLSDAVDLYQECKLDPSCSQQNNLRFALDDFAQQIIDRQTITDFKIKKPSPRDQSRSEQLKGWGASAELKERPDPLRDLTKFAQEYPGGPQMISDDAEKIRCYQTAKYLVAEMRNPVNPIKPLVKDKVAVDFARQTLREIKDDVEALLAKKTGSKIVPGIVLEPDEDELPKAANF